MANNIHLYVAPSQFKDIYAAIDTARDAFKMKKQRGDEGAVVHAICQKFMKRGGPKPTPLPEFVQQAAQQLRADDESFKDKDDLEVVAGLCRRFVEGELGAPATLEETDPPKEFTNVIAFMREANPEYPEGPQHDQELLASAMADYIGLAKSAKSAKPNAGSTTGKK